jgi:hypothetical protein
MPESLNNLDQKTVSLLAIILYIYIKLDNFDQEQQYS